ncbi:EAL domain-containing protein [Undibacterium sp.]|uniref:EAL domain-containing protein n=1 Tax=Undibacterium sp. TaxID=1914977 RepID=UPI002B84827E|nr:EAL domain-containing protein [Undibacterium sp.]HTD06315.1 EAL domain-containing protein [Undibacterium sp.]
MNTEIRKLPLVLIVDDDAMTRMLVSEALEPEGFEIEEAASGAEGIEIFERTHPDIVLLDVSMPGMNGFECCERIRRLPNGERVPIVVLTGNDDDDSITRAFDAGATDFVSKPMRWKLLGHRVRYLLRASDALEDLARSQASLVYAQELAHVGNWEYRAGSIDGYWSPELYRILGLDAELDSASFDSLIRRIPEDERPQLIHSFMSLRTEGTGYEMEHRVTRPDGGERIVCQQAEALQESGRTVLLRGTLQDITERKANEARIEYLANHDALTDLPNRNLLNDRIGQAIAQVRRTDQCLAVLVLDLDRFKLINDSYGHPVGDALLKAVAVRLKAAVREGDTVARLGGDEFVIILTGLADTETAKGVVQKVLTMFVSPFVLNSHELHVTTSIGVSVFPEDGTSGDMLLKTADAALYSAKDKGRNGYQFYTRKMGVQVEERAELENALHQALALQEFELHYQPKVDLRSGKVYGMEALLRWRRPEIGMMPPDRFIPLAEETGLIIQIGEWVLRTACAQLKEWHETGHPDLTMAVNVSARQFRLQDVPDLVCNVLADTGLSAEYLELELTESLLMQNREVVVKALERLKKIGITLSLDDFGTGYSSLSYLKQFPIDVVKIDQSFIRDVTNSVDGASLTRSIIAMAESLHMTTVAEGVETEGQLGFLNNNHCDAMQGYYFSRPLPKHEMTALLGAGTHLPANSCHREPTKRTLLIVDDDENTLAALQRLLRRDGYRILSTTSPREALELLAIHSVGVIVSDVRMPEMPGTELLRCVKGLYPSIVRIMLSGYTELQSVTDAINEGAVYKFLTKPWDDALLREHLAESFRHYELKLEDERLK